MPKKVKHVTYSELLDGLRRLQFDVTPVPNVADQMWVQKYGCAAIIGPDPEGSTYRLIHPPGVVYGKEIAHLVNRGYQQQFHTARGDFAATAEHLHRLHRFVEELKETAGVASLYNESLGTISDDHFYDRVKGRDLPPGQQKTPAWKLPSAK